MYMRDGLHLSGKPLLLVNLLMISSSRKWHGKHNKYFW